MYLTIRSKDDASKLQNDLDKLAEWEHRWQMSFHPEKCQIISITRRRNKISHNYVLHGHSLAHVQSAKYLGVTITHDLNWNKHIAIISNKSSITLAFLKRILRINNRQLKTTAYETLVRPQLEYASTVWDPYTQTNIYQLEKVQRRAARYTLNRYNNTSSVTDMLQELNWQTLENRRKLARLTMMYKIRQGLVILDNASDRLRPSIRSSRASHDQAYEVPHSRANYHQFSFIPKTIRDWNALPFMFFTHPP